MVSSAWMSLSSRLTLHTCLLFSVLVSCMANNLDIELSTDAPAEQKCWVYLHMNKGGGTRVKKVLYDWCTENNVTSSLFASTSWLKGSEYSIELSDSNVPLIFGGYVEGLRAFGRLGDKCQWFTMFRNPVLRLVSAYFFCRNTWDQLCGKHAADVNNMDLVSFAEHWGNYGLRQFALSSITWDEVHTSRAAAECIKCAPWYKLKLYLIEGQSNQANEDTNGSDEGLERLVQPALDLIESGYAAVGILEDFDLSLELFTRALRLPGLDWVSRYYSVNLRKAHSETQERKDALRLAWTDPSIFESIKLDILLYQHAVGVHDRQLHKYNVVP